MPSGDRQALVAVGRFDKGDFRNIATTLPGFAGYYYVPGTHRLIIAMSDNTPPDAAVRTVMRTFATKGHGRFGAPTFEVRRARFPFTLLAKLRDEVEPSAMAVSGVNWLDLDEESNRLSFGVSNNGVATIVSRIMGAAGAPVGKQSALISPTGRSGNANLGCFPESDKRACVHSRIHRLRVAI